jgi:hypothetical protein
MTAPEASAIKKRPLRPLQTLRERVLAGVCYAGDDPADRRGSTNRERRADTGHAGRRSGQVSHPSGSCRHSARIRLSKWPAKRPEKIESSCCPHGTKAFQASARSAINTSSQSESRARHRHVLGSLVYQRAATTRSTISTRRFVARPSSVRLVATGATMPAPAGVRRLAAMPEVARALTIDWARRCDKERL